MDHKNITQFSGFILHGFSSHPDVQSVLFPVILFIYLLTLLGNIAIILLIHSDAQLLQSPMYFFLSNLAVADVGFATTVVPKALENMLAWKQTISFHGCLTQMFSFMYFGNADIYLLASMAYDRYIAICHPLHYSAMMSHTRCLQLATVSWTIPMAHSLLYTFLMSLIDFCGSREIPHFLCDIYPVLGLSCSDNSLIELLMVTEGIVEILGPFVLILISYAFIFYTIMKIPSVVGKFKAFSTCGSHMCVVLMYFGAISFVYFIPDSTNSDYKDMVSTVIYTMVNPMLNPFIYTLRNSKIKAGMRKVIRQCFHYFRRGQVNE